MYSSHDNNIIIQYTTTTTIGQVSIKYSLIIANFAYTYVHV